jgi:hypothetical protein
MIWASPFFLMFTFFNGWQTYVISTGIATASFAIAYFLETRFLLKNSTSNFDSAWETTIYSDEYQQISKEKSARRYISPQAIEELLHREAELNDHLRKLTQHTIQKSSQIPILDSIPPVQYNLIGKPCPKCGKPIEFADFCVECEIKFCPKCDQEYDPYSIRCVCGFQFPNLENEFQLKFSTGESKK